LEYSTDSFGVKRGIAGAALGSISRGPGFSNLGDYNTEQHD
jgi:hypothetical protein